ncbi:hypothetical protein H4219_005534 [Mycoemilia scoparia]|uniref:Uncharacterized protein n=1 Tax=Mycoemilia scoparia TaxID=417184 RepID=A0A9W7ZSR3_9FUNG|nr:hypothetical protein H4219_005534 [Mycoemilia scoparia]
MDRSKPPPYRNSIQCIATIFRKEGLLGFYKGTSASFLGISEGTIQWMLYERFKKIIRDKKAKLENIPGGDHSIKKSINDWFEYFGAAASAKLISAVIAYPHEVLRTRLRQLPDSNGQVKYTGLTQAAKVIWKEEGLFAFYGGLAPHLMRTVPNAAIMFLSYELVLHYFGSS